MTRTGFTLIELLIVVAIIAILAAIAVPNFLEAQTRSKVSRAQADLRSMATAVEAYNVDWNRPPKAMLWSPPLPGEFSTWWGFLSAQLTTPVAYVTTLASMPFIDKEVLAQWKTMGGTQSNQPYTYIRGMHIAAGWPAGSLSRFAGASANVPNAPIPEYWPTRARRAGYIVYTSGPDGIDGTVSGVPEFYDPTNGTVSYGDIYRFGSGNADRNRNQ